jgi:tight adherence protein C
MLELAIILTFLSVTSFIYFISQTWLTRNRQIKTRLERLKPVVPVYGQIDVDLEKPLGVRLLAPVFGKLSGVVLKLTPLNQRNQADHMLALAGYPWNLSVNDFLVIKMITLIGVPLLFFMIVGVSNSMGWVNVAAALILAMILPDFMLKRQIKARQVKITRELPDNLDLLTVSVEAGLGFDQALLKLVEKTKGPLSGEFKRVLHEIRIGKTRRDALRQLATRTGVEDLQAFVAAIIQADQLGVSIGNVLRIQSQQLRQKRRLKAEERAQKAPVKMLIPMILFIFPSLFIILLGPGILQLIDSFSKVQK